MNSLIFTLFLSIYSITSSQAAQPLEIEPDLIDAEMTLVMYRIEPNSLKTIAYKNGYPSTLNIKLCQACRIKPYTLEINAEILLNEQPLALEDLSIELIKKNYDSVELGLNRSTQAVTHLYLGGISELDAKARAQEQSDEY
jgi:hypothetical protein